MITFKEYLIEYDIDQEVTGKKDVSQNGDDELVLWVLNDEYLYDAARSARSFEDLMSEIDNEFNYNNDQYNALARAFRMGELGEEAQYDNIVIEPNDGRGIGVVVYGYKRNNDGVERTLLNDFQTLADAKQEYPTASVTAS